MIWVLGILLFICLLLLWFLISPLVLEIDSRKPAAMLKWVSIGKAIIWYEEEWWVSFRVFFFRKKIRLSSIKRTQKKTTDQPAKKTKRKTKGLFRKIVRVLRTCKVEEWQLAIDTGDYALNAQIYPLNFWPVLHHHFGINFNDENYLYVKISNRPVRILYAYLR
jgi:hypothetical protein